jgi:hypothetical protein
MEVRHRRTKPPINPSIWTADSEGFGCNENRFLWQDISKITIYLVDFFMYDRIEVCLTIGSRVQAITEGDVGFTEFVEHLQSVFPAVEEPMGFLSNHPFSEQVFEIDTQAKMT